MMLMPGFFVAKETGKILTGWRLRGARAVLWGRGAFGFLPALPSPKPVPNW
jgi:hypothetical protein